MIAIDDPEVADAVGFIHDHATELIQVEDVVQHVAISRRNLETRFRKSVGRTPHAELQRIRLQRAIRFLVETDLSIPKISDAVGYTTPSYFIQVFRKEHGTTPARYRRQMRSADGTE
jgi:LacI family transcriptional regulator